MSGESVTGSPAQPGGTDEESNDLGEVSGGWPNMAGDRSESHSPQRKWPGRRSSIRAHGSAPFAATLVATRHHAAASDARPGQTDVGHRSGDRAEPLEAGRKVGPALSPTRGGPAAPAPARKRAHGDRSGSPRPSTSSLATRSGQFEPV
jgi:hypothetical protein